MTQQPPRPHLIGTHRDGRLQARIVGRQELHYASGADSTTDRPAFVRSASGLGMMDGELVVIQDDASFLAFVRPDGAARAVALPTGPGGRRRFEEALGNRLDKIDLESVIVVAGIDGLRLLAFGSGSLPPREWLLSYSPGVPDAVHLVDASPLYASLRALPFFSGESLNIEGVALVGNLLRLFERGNGTADVNPASVDIPFRQLIAWLDTDGELPEPTSVRWYDLGNSGSVRYGFTDACALGQEGVLFLACAENSPNPVDDGEVRGSRMGVLEGDGGRWIELVDERGMPALVKAEGVVIDAARTDTAWVVLDPDDAECPAELCQVALSGPWPSVCSNRHDHA